MSTIERKGPAAPAPPSSSFLAPSVTASSLPPLDPPAAPVMTTKASPMDVDQSPRVGLQVLNTDSQLRAVQLELDSVKADLAALKSTFGKLQSEVDELEKRKKASGLSDEEKAELQRLYRQQEALYRQQEQLQTKENLLLQKELQSSSVSAAPSDQRLHFPPSFDFSRFDNPGFFFRFQSYPQFEALVARLCLDVCNSESGNRSYFWYSIIGSSGRGKTRAAVESTQRVRRELRYRSLAAFFKCGGEIFPSVWNERDRNLCSRALAFVLYECFTTMHLALVDSTPGLLDLFVGALASHASFSLEKFIPCFLILDEFQRCPRTVTCLLRAIDLWNSTRPITGTPGAPKVIFVPILSGTTAADVDVKDLCAPTGFLNYNTFVPLLFDQPIDPFRPLLQEEFPKLPVNDPMFRRLTDHLGRWPVAFEYLHQALTQNPPPILLDSDYCSFLFEKVLQRITQKYGNDFESQTPPMLSFQVLLFSACDHLVQRDDKLDGFTWGEIEKKGHYSLILQPPSSSSSSSSSAIEVVTAPLFSDLKDDDSSSALPSQIRRDATQGASAIQFNEEKKVLFHVQIPFILWVALNMCPHLQIVDPQLLNPFHTNWQEVESLSIASLLLRVRYFRYLGRSSASVAELRPDAFASDAVKQVLVPLCDLSHPSTPGQSPCLSAWIQEDARHWGGKPDWSLPVHCGVSRIKWDLKDGGLCYGTRNQTDCEMVAVFVSEKPGMRRRVLWLTQVKSKDILDPRTGFPTHDTPTSRSDVAQVVYDLRKPFLHVPFDAVVVDWFSFKPLWKRGGSVDGAIVTSRECLPTVLGPVFAQRALTFMAQYNAARG